MANPSAPKNVKVSPVKGEMNTPFTLSWEPPENAGSSGSWDFYLIYQKFDRLDYSGDGEYENGKYGVLFLQQGKDSGSLHSQQSINRFDPIDSTVTYTVFCGLRSMEGSTPVFTPVSPGASAVFTLAVPNAAPSTPGFLTVTPTSAQAGEILSLSWGQSVDPDGNLLQYELEKCVNGVWQSHFMGNQLAMQVSVEHHWKGAVQFRVRAVDTEGLYSDYAVSDPVTILADIFPDGGRLELFQNQKAEPVFPVTVLDGVFRRSDKKPLSAILEDAGAVQGPAGKGVPAGGVAGQMLVKKSAADYDTQWVVPPEGGGSSGGVTSFNGRTGVVMPQKGDYTAADVGAATMEEVNAAIQQAVLESWEGSY